MATIIANKKNGKIVSYRFRAYLGRNEFGEQIARYTTWHIPDGLTPSRAAKAAEKAALAWERQIKETHKNAAADSEGVSSRQDKKIEFSDFVLNTWFPICIENGEHKPTTVSFYRYTVNRLVTHFRGRAIQDVSTIEIKKYLAYLRKDYRTKQGKPLSDKTIRHTYCVLVLIFDFAAEERYITESPMRNVDCPKIAKKKVDALSKEQAEYFFTLLPQCDAEFRCMLYLLITTGLRRGELLGLRWKNIDFDGLTITVENNVTYAPGQGNIFGTTKTRESERTIPMLPGVAKELKEYKAAQSAKSRLGLVFPGKIDADKPRAPSAITHRVKRFMKKNGLPDLSPHDLRHSCATLLVANGADIKSIQEILGHTDASTTLNFYVGTNLERMKEATRKLGDSFGLSY